MSILVTILVVVLTPILVGVTLMVGAGVGYVAAHVLCWIGAKYYELRDK